MDNNYYQKDITNSSYGQVNGNSYEQIQDKILASNIPEQLYVDTVLKENEGKFAKIYVTVPGSNSWQDKLFEGVIEKTGNDHIIMSNTNTNERYLIPLMYIVFVIFNN